jgi:DNA mismatch endonuclease (patch repair protein)
MRKQRQRNTSPELLVRRDLFARGLRYRIHYPVPGLRRRSIDVAFPRRKVAVFVDGCFWHGCPQHGTAPRSNSEWWAAKIDRNRARDAETTEVLVSLGWKVLRFWEHEDPDEVARLVAAEVGARAGHRR